MEKDSGEERSFEVLLEDIEKDVRRIAEGHGILAKGINRLEEHFLHWDKRFELLEQAVAAHTAKLDQIIVRFDAHEHTHAG